MKNRFRHRPVAPTRILRWLGVEAGEAAPLGWLVVRALVASAATVLGLSYQSALFLQFFPASLLPWQYAASALAVVAVTPGYAALRRRWSESGAERALLAVIAAGLAAGSLAPRLLLEPVSVFLFTVWVGLAGFFANLGVWDAAVRLFPGRRARWLTPLVSAAATLGCVLGGLLTRLLAASTGNDALLPVLLGLTALAALLAARPTCPEAPPSRSVGRAAGILRQGAALLRSNRLALFLTLVVFLSTPLFLVVDFAFKKGLQQHYDADGVATFLGDYYLGVNAAVFLAQTFLMGRLLTRVGVTLVAVATPAAAAVAAGFLIGVSSLAAAAALATVVGVLRYTFFQNSRNQLLTPLSPPDKSTASLLSRTVVLPVGSVAAGLVLLPARDADLAALGLLAVVLALTLIWAAGRAGAAYGEELLSSLRRRVLTLGPGEEGFAQPDAAAVRVLRRTVQEGDDHDADFCASILAQWNLLEAGDVEHLVGRSDRDVRRRALDLAERLDRSARESLLARRIEQETDDELRETICERLAGIAPTRAARLGETWLSGAATSWRRVVGARLLLAAGRPMPAERVADVLRDLDGSDVPRLAALRVAAAIGGTAGIERTRRALDDGDRAVRRAALGAIAAARLAPLFPELERALADPPCREAAFAALAAVGGLDDLLRRHLFERPDPRTAFYLVRAVARPDTAVDPATQARLLEGGRTWVRAALLAALERPGGSGLPPAVESRRLERSLALELAGCVLARHRARAPHTVLELDFQRTVTRRAVFSALRLADPADRPWLMRVESSLDSSDPRRRNAALELLESRTRAGRPWLVPALEGSTEQALLALRRLGVTPPAEDAEAASLCWTFSPDRWMAAAVEALEKGTEMHDPLVDPKLLGKAVALRRSALFRDLATETLLEIARRAEEVYLGAGDLLFEEGQAADGLYFVAAGELEVLLHGRRINELRSGAVLGEVALLDRGPRTATVRARSSAELLRLSPELFDDVLEDYPEVARAAIALLVEHIRRQSAGSAAEAPTAEVERRS